MKEERTDNSGPSWVSDVGCQKKRRWRDGTSRVRFFGSMNDSVFLSFDACIFQYGGGPVRNGRVVASYYG